MSDLTDDDLLAGIRAYWESRDPVPDGMTARLQAAAALAASDTDLDMELMLLVERTEELAGARGASTTAYTLRFAHEGVDLLLRVSGDGDHLADRRLGGPALADQRHGAPRRRRARDPRGRRHRPLRASRSAPRDVAAPARAGRRAAPRSSRPPSRSEDRCNQRSPASRPATASRSTASPSTPPRDAFSVVQGRVLDPATALFVEGVEPRPTVYVGPRLTISKSIDIDAAMEVLRPGRGAARLDRRARARGPADWPSSSTGCAR